MSLKTFGQRLKDYFNLPLMGYFKPKDTGAPLRTIQLIDIREGSIGDILNTQMKDARRMIVGTRKTFGWISRIITPVTLPLTDFLSRRWLRKSNNPYRQEIIDSAKAIKRGGTYTLNMSYEWGCTSGVYNTGDNATLSRVQDWPLPLMGDNLVVAHQKGTAGDFYNVPWAGYSGVVHAMAPGRFSAALNKAPMRRTKRSSFRDFFHSRFKVGRTRSLPPPHLLRQAFEKAATYEEAKQMLLTTEITLPAIFILSGTKPGEGCVIERTEKTGFAREMSDGRVVAANHFETSLNGNGDAWKSRLANGSDRAEYGRSIPAEQIADKSGFPWFTCDAAKKSGFASHFSRVVMTANSAEGTMQLMGTGGEKPVTEIFRIGPAPANSPPAPPTA